VPGLSLSDQLGEVRAKLAIAGGARIDPALAVLRRELEHGSQEHAKTLRRGSRRAGWIVVGHRTLEEAGT
jgi:hypothetical protein